MSLHHIGKVIAVHGPKNTRSATQSTQATLEMWDENILTLTVDPKIARLLKETDYVLVDYTPVEVKGTNLIQRQIVTKILKTGSAEKTWQLYKRHHLERQKHATESRKDAESGYMG